MVCSQPVIEDVVMKKQPMMRHKIYQVYKEGYEVLICFRDQQRWLEQAHIIHIEGDFVTLRYETDDEEEICSWEEMVRLDSISSVIRQLPVVPTGNVEPGVVQKCPDTGPIQDSHPEANPN